MQALLVITVVLRSFALIRRICLQALYDSIFLMGFNIFFSSAPILLFGISEQNYSDATLLKNPQLYQLQKKNYLMSTSQFIMWMFMGKK